MEIIRETRLHVLSRQREFHRNQSLRIVNEYTTQNGDHTYVNKIWKIVRIFYIMLIVFMCVLSLN